jgi:hypothetical protein
VFLTVRVLGCFRKAAHKGNTSVQFYLGLMYDQDPVRRDYRTAAKWYCKAAERGHVDAQARLGIMLEKGQGIPQDYIRAHLWFNLAAAKSVGQEQRKFASSRNEIAARMTPEQIAEAQRLAREWKPIK